MNVVGSFLIGVLATLADGRGALGSETRVLLVVGVLGRVTTFSSFTLDAIRLVEADELLRSGAYIVASLAVAFLAAIVGIALARSINR